MWKRRVLLGLSAVAVTVAATAFIGVVAWDARSADWRQRLDGARAPAGGPFSADEVSELPEPVERFFRRVLKEGQPSIGIVDLETEGMFQTGTDDSGWKRFSATQRFTTAPRGLVWNARIHMAPFMPVYVRDAYVGGRTEMRASLMGLHTLVDERDVPALAAGQLHRFIAEAMWFPTALLPSHGVWWQPIDTTSAVARLSDRGVSVSARFSFTPDGDIREVFALDRMRAVDGRYEPTEWLVRCDDHQPRQGIRIPLRCEAAWILPDGPLPYWRGRVVDVRYEWTR